MATWSHTFSIGFNRTVSVGNTVWGDVQYFTPPKGINITGCRIYYTTNADSGASSKTFYIRDVNATPGSPASGSSLSYNNIVPGESNKFSIRFQCTAGSSATWNISSIRIEITYAGGDPGTLTLNKSSMQAGETVAVTLGKADSNIKRTLRVYYGSEATAMDTLGTNLGSAKQTINWEFPIERCDKMWDRTSGTIKFTMTPTEGSAVSKTMTISVPEDVVPSIGDFEVALNRNGVPEDFDDYIQHKSKCDYEISDAESMYGAEIVSQKVTVRSTTVEGETGSIGPFVTPGLAVLTATVTDSRGRTATATQTINVLSYSPPAPSGASAVRCDEDGTENPSGSYVLIESDVAFVGLNGANDGELKYRVYRKGTTPGVWQTGTVPLSVVVSASIDYSQTVEIMALDALGESTSIVFELGTGIWLIHGITGEDGIIGAAINKTAEKVDCLEVNYNRIELKGGVGVLKEGDAEYLGRNVLHNWDFRRPVNQRGVSGTISSGTYFFDRWIRHAGTVTVEDGYLTLGNAATIEQRIEGHDLTGETVTLSVRVGNDVYSGTAVFPASGEEAVDLGGFGAGLLGYHADYLYVRLTADGAQDIVSVKLEMGEQSTLHLDPPMDYGVELAKCQRYYEELGTGVYFMAYTKTNVIVSSPFAVYKRITPSFSLLIDTMVLTEAVSSYTATTLTMLGSAGDKKGMRQAVLSGFTGLTPGKIYYCNSYYDGIIGASSDL